jgi:ribosomal protein S18 acetylase RimI-like enzyme
MVTIRPLRYQEDRAQLSQLDTSFTTNRIYQVHHAGLSFSLREAVVDPPIRKDYGLGQDLDELNEIPFVVVAEENASITGLAAVKFEVWNRRAVIWHLYVAPDCRSRGIGAALMQACLEYAKSNKARCLWLETQNINYPVIQFYQKMGFAFCGLDTTLYDPERVNSNEFALFFARQLV